MELPLAAPVVVSGAKMNRVAPDWAVESALRVWRAVGAVTQFPLIVSCSTNVPTGDVAGGGLVPPEPAVTSTYLEAAEDVDAEFSTAPDDEFVWMREGRG